MTLIWHDRRLESLYVEGEVQHVFFHRVARADLLHPLRLDIDMTGGAGTGAAAVGIDAGNHVLDCGLHDRHAGRTVDGLFGTVVLDEGDLGHAAESVEAFVLSNGLLGDHGAKHNCQRGE